MQQINLYHPIFREERRVFSAGTVGATLGLVSLALAGLWAFGSWRLQRLEHGLAALRKQHTEQDARLHHLAGGQSMTPAQVEQRLAALSSQLARRSEALHVLESGEAGSTDGFAKRLEALARSHQEGLWLRHLSLHGSALTLSGNALDAGLVPRYLEGLSRQPSLAGTRFDHLLIENDADAAGVTFEVATVVPVSREDERS